MSTDDGGHAILWFGEGLGDRNYHMPDAIAAAEIRQSDAKQPLATKPIESEDLIGLRSVDAIERSGELATTVTYGLYHGSKLTYHVEHLPGSSPADWPTQPRAGAALQTVIVPTNEGGVQVSVLKEGNPLAAVGVKLFDSEGNESSSGETDAQGQLTFDAAKLHAGLNGVMVGFTDKQASGTYKDEPYSSTSDYLTATFFAAKSNENSAKPNESSVVRKADLPGLPEELTSFGAAILDGKLYAYGGHTGNAHSYSTAEQSGRLWALDLAAGEDGRWEKVLEGPKLQGLALVAHAGKLIRIGGFTAVNDVGEEHDLRSQTSVAAFDPSSGTWSDLPSLPEPRSSFDAAVLDDRVYVFGGWKLAGDSDESHWHTSAWSLDLSDPASDWQSLAPMPVQRRALAVAAHDQKLFLIGGMNADGGPTTEVLIYDPANDSWAPGQSLPGEGMAGFGSAAFATGGALYVSVYDGHIFVLADEGQSWKTVAKLESGRFFHRMLPVSDDELIILGGANMQVGKFTEILTVNPGGDREAG